LLFGKEKPSKNPPGGKKNVTLAKGKRAWPSVTGNLCEKTNPQKEGFPEKKRKDGRKAKRKGTHPTTRGGNW